MFRRLLAEEGEIWDTVEVQHADPPSDEVLGSYDVRQLALRADALPCTGAGLCQALFPRVPCTCLQLAGLH